MKSQASEVDASSVLETAPYSSVVSCRESGDATWLSRLVVEDAEAVPSLGVPEPSPEVLEPAQVMPQLVQASGHQLGIFGKAFATRL